MEKIMRKIMRKIIHIDEDLCDGCGLCIPSCHEHALQLVDTPKGKKARLVKELHCDGLGDCLGACPTGALTIEDREADPYDEVATMKRVAQKKPLDPSFDPFTGSSGGCPSAKTMQWETGDKKPAADSMSDMPSELRQWPVQIHLVPLSAPYFRDTDLCIIADCVPFAYADFHRDFIKDKTVVVGCPKLDDTGAYLQKLAAIFSQSRPRSIEVVMMEVPCCSGLSMLVKNAVQQSGTDIPLRETIISIQGKRK
jgi:ferredoxin